MPRAPRVDEKPWFFWLPGSGLRSFLFVNTCSVSRRSPWHLGSLGRRPLISFTSVPDPCPQKQKELPVVWCQSDDFVDVPLSFLYVFSPSRRVRPSGHLLHISARFVWTYLIPVTSFKTCANSFPRRFQTFRCRYTASIGSCQTSLRPY